MNNKNLILIGGGGHCKSVIDVAESAGFNIIGILDVAENVGEKVLGYQIIGTDEQINEYVKDCLFCVTVGQIKNSLVRIKLHNQIEVAGGKLATIISPSAHVSKYSEIGQGTVVMHMAVVNANVKIGTGCIINTFANIEHDAVVGDYSHISTGAMVNGNCEVGREVFIGSQAVLINGIKIASNCVLAAGATVIKDVNVEGVYAGNPAKLILKE